MIQAQPMCIREAITKAEEQAAIYPTTTWHVIRLGHGFETVSETYFRKRPRSESFYNTKARVYRGVEFLPGGIPEVPFEPPRFPAEKSR